MNRAFVISDTHFGHKNIITFKDNEGKIVRDFPSIEDHDAHLVKCWNLVISPKDTVYHLGDVAINKKGLPILEELHGRKILVKGNHDIFEWKDYLYYFDDIRAYKVMPEYGIIMSHIPIHPDSMSRWKLNIHGHLHHNSLNDPRYRCVSVEQINYVPLDLEVIIQEMA